MQVSNTNVDQICMYKETDGTQSLCVIVENIPSHRLSVLNLPVGLVRADDRSMNISRLQHKTRTIED